MSASTTWEEIDLLEWPLAGGETWAGASARLDADRSTTGAVPDRRIRYPGLEYARTAATARSPAATATAARSTACGPLHLRRFLQRQNLVRRNASGTWQADLFTTLGIGNCARSAKTSRATCLRLSPAAICCASRARPISSSPTGLNSNNGFRVPGSGFSVFRFPFSVFRLTVYGLRFTAVYGSRYSAS